MRLTMLVLGALVVGACASGSNGFDPTNPPVPPDVRQALIDALAARYDFDEACVEAALSSMPERDLDDVLMLADDARSGEGELSAEGGAALHDVMQC